LIYIFYGLAALLILQGLFSLIEGIQLLRFANRSLHAPLSDFAPKAVIIVPCKGIDAGLEENLAALFEQDYPEYEIIFAVASAADSALPVIKKISERPLSIKSQIAIAKESNERSEKVNNLLSALDLVGEDVSVLVFTDSDARARRDWLRSLVAPLADNGVGAATGYRWHLPERGGFWSALLSAWNGSVATTLGDHSRNFAWGGSTAILRDTFERIGVRDSWQHAASDDYALTRAAQSANLSIAFAPRCLMASREDMSFSSLIEFTTRQVIITRVYRPKMWRVGLITNSLFSAIFFGGLAYLAIEALRGVLQTPSLIMLATIYLLGSIKGALRFVFARRAIAEARDEINKLWWMYCLLWPIVALVFLFNFLKSATTRCIVWRGASYEMISPSETRVIR
jgi:ceramide glucosyltransferase